ncbi:MAG: BTAD domain-containing putative transcriptional regulator, partial [Chloroflexota bacterium]
MSMSYARLDNTQPTTTDHANICVHISFFGTTTIRVDGQTHGKTPGHKSGALLVYLVRNLGPHTRMHLADLLWDNLPRTRLLGNLRALIKRLPDEIKPYIHITPEALAFKVCDEVWVDVLAVDDLAAQLPTPELRRDDTRYGQPRYTDLYMTQLHEKEHIVKDILRLYKGAFLEELIVDGAPRFAEWQRTQQETLRRLTADVLRNIVDLCLHQGRYVDGIAYARRWIALDPLEEESRRQLMVMLALDGQQQVALNEYDTLVAM